MTAIDTIGHNMPPAVAAAQAAADYLARCQALTITSQEDAQAAAVLIDEGTKGRKAADADRAAEKEPHLTAGREVDASWKPAIETYDAGAKLVKANAAAWLKAERERQAEAARIAREEEERKMHEAMQAMAAAQASNDAGAALEAELAAASADIAAERAAALEAATAAPAQVRAEGIRARGLRTVWEVEITDPVALVTALANHPAVQEAAANVAAVRARVDKAAFSLPGCKAVAREVL